MSAVQQATTLCHALTETVARYPDAPALRSADGATEWTWAQYWARIQDAAAGLAGIGVGRGDTVVLWLSNRPEFHVADTAAMQLGAPAFSIYSTFTVEHAEYVFADAGSRVLVTELTFLDRGIALRDHATVLSINGDSYRMRAHQAAIAALRPAITSGEFS